MDVSCPSLWPFHWCPVLSLWFLSLLSSYLILSFLSTIICAIMQCLILSDLFLLFSFLFCFHPLCPLPKCSVLPLPLFCPMFCPIIYFPVVSIYTSCAVLSCSLRYEHCPGIVYGERRNMQQAPILVAWVNRVILHLHSGYPGGASARAVHAIFRAGRAPIRRKCILKHFIRLWRRWTTTKSIYSEKKFYIWTEFQSLRAQN